MKVAITVPADDCPAVLVRVLPPKSSPGKTVLYRKYDPLFVYETRAQGRKEFLSPCEGTLLQWRIKAGQTIATHQYAPAGFPFFAQHDKRSHLTWF